LVLFLGGQGKIREGGSSCKLYPPCCVQKEKIEMNNEMFLYGEDVVSMSPDASFTGSPTSTCEELLESVRDLAMNSRLQKDVVTDWFGEGISCRVLFATGGGWQKGRLSLRLEFIPDKPKVPQQKPSTASSDPVSPLDDLRSQLNPE
jgi:KGK domain